MATIPTPSLFPNVPIQRGTPANSLPPNSAAGLSGIARLAADSPLADAKRGVEYFQIPVRSILNHCDSERVPFKLTINPYRGCEFGCVYCYARYTHEYMELDGSEFERKIYAKANAGPIVSRDLAREDVIGEHIAIGTATDPYQPAEREFGVTREILEKFALREGLQFSITTKSNQVTRDIDLLQRISERSAVSSQIRDRVSEAMNELSPVERTAFVLRHFEGMGMEEVGRVLGCCANTAKHSVFRAVHKLRKALEPLANSAR